MINDPLFYGGLACAAIVVLFLIGLIVLIIKNSNKNVLIRQMQTQIRDITLNNQQLSEVNNGLSSENIRLKTEFANQRRYMEDKIQYIENSKNELSLRFRDISNEILHQQSEQLTAKQQNTLNSLLTPFKEQLQTFKDEVSKANIENIKNKSSFDEQFKNLLSLNQSLSQDAQNLTNALRGNKKMQGDWGEIELNRLLEISGLQKNIDYFTQENFKNENNQNLRPDVIVKLPNDRSVVIDSKVSMNDYVAYVNEDNETAKSGLLLKHIQCLKAHIDELSAKEYQKLLKEESLDYVVIFIPIESAFIEAIRNDSSLYDYAYKKNIALTTPSSLLPILRTIENLWQLENRNKHVQEIARIGGSLFDKIANFVEDMQKIDRSLNTAKQSYEQAIAKLSTGKGNALSLANRLKEYGAQTNKFLNIEYEQEQTLIENASERKVS
ncbi:MAG: DNA recombination protein RmuC [Alphaproteobacteria bacterium]|nr:DNA recombination protein RmuC [Alphaproteobacteria bacterium]